MWKKKKHTHEILCGAREIHCGAHKKLSRAQYEINVG